MIMCNDHVSLNLTLRLLIEFRDSDIESYSKCGPPVLYAGHTKEFCEQTRIVEMASDGRCTIQASDHQNRLPCYASWFEASMDM